MVAIDRKEVERPDSGEEMSETEMRVQIEQNEIYKLNRELLKMGGEEVLISRYTGLKQKQRKEEEGPPQARQNRRRSLLRAPARVSPGLPLRRRHSLCNRIFCALLLRPTRVKA